MEIEGVNSSDSEFYGSFFNSINELHNVLREFDEPSFTADMQLEKILQEMQSKLKFINEKLNNFKA